MHETQTILEQTWQELSAATNDNANPWRTPALATISDERPEVRTIVLRRVDSEKRSLWFHTDLRSSKVFQLRRNADVSWLFWNPATQIQLRLHAIAKLDADAIDARALWGETTPRVRDAYRSTLTPGEPLETMLTHRPVGGDDGFQNFLAIETIVHEMEWLKLDPSMHRRLKITWNDRDGAQFRWIAP